MATSEKSRAGSNCGIAYSGGAAYLVARIRRRWVLIRGRESLEMALSGDASLAEAIKFAESNLRSS